MSQPEIYPVHIDHFFAEQTSNPKLQAFEPMVCYSDGDHEAADGPQYNEESPFYQEPDHAWSNIVVLRDVESEGDGEKSLNDLVFNVGTWKDSKNLPTLPIKGFGECYSKKDGWYFWAIDAEGQAWSVSGDLDEGLLKCSVNAVLKQLAIYPGVLQEVNAVIGALNNRGSIFGASKVQSLKSKPDYTLN